MKTDRVLVQTLEALQKRRAVVFYPALVLSVVAVLRRGGVIAMGCGLLWALAGALCVMEARTLMKMNLKPRSTIVDALCYFAIAGLFLFRR